MMYHHEVMKKVSFSGPEKSWWVSLVDDITVLGCIATRGVKGGGFGFNTGKAANGSPLISLTMRKRSGSAVATGLTFKATGLYFFFAVSSAATGLGIR